MLRFSLFALVFAASAAAAEDLDLTPLIKAGGLAGAEAALNGEDPENAMALGGVRFLQAIEGALQLRYRHNAVFGNLQIPVLRLPIPPNSSPELMYPGLVADIFRAIETHMSEAREALARAEGDFGVTLDLTSLWFDINANGLEDAGEDIFAVAAATFAAPVTEPGPLVVRFDSADAAWLTAYTHMLSGLSNLVLAFDPTPVVAEVTASIAEMNALRGSEIPRTVFMSPNDEVFLDIFAIAYGALNQQPDAMRTRAARDHWLAMVAENRRFWQAVAAESDNDREWIPNAVQQAALGIELPPDTGQTWLRVLDDAEAVLNGELLVGHWRVSPAAGVNVAKLMQNPIPVDIVTWTQGHGLAPYMERGTLADTQSLRRFEQLVGGDAAFFAILLN